MRAILEEMEWLLVAFLSGILTFNSVVTPDAAAKTARQALQKQFPGAKVAVEIEGRRGNDVLNGQFRKIVLQLEGASFESLPFSSQPPGPQIGHAQSLEIDVKNATWEGLAVEKIEFQFQNLQFDWKALRENSEFRLVSGEKGVLRVRLNAQSLLPTVQSRIQGGENMAVKLRGGELIVSGQRAVLGVAAPFELRARPFFQGKQIGLGGETLLVSGTTIPSALVRPLVGDLSNFYTFDKTGSWPFDVAITSVHAENDALEIAADLTLKSGRLSGKTTR